MGEEEEEEEEEEVEGQVGGKRGGKKKPLIRKWAKPLVNDAAGFDRKRRR